MSELSRNLLVEEGHYENGGTDQRAQCGVQESMPAEIIPDEITAATMENLPSWLSTILYGMGLLVSGFIGAIAFANKISSRFDNLESNIKTLRLELEKYVDKETSRRHHDLIGVMQVETGKQEKSQEKALERIRLLEQKMAVQEDRTILQTTLTGLLMEMKQERERRELERRP